MPFNLPPDVTFEKLTLPEGGYSYAFRHRTLGYLGRILVQGVGAQSHIACEAVGDPNDPMTSKRLAVFEPIAKTLTSELERISGKGIPVPPPPSPKSGQWVRRKLMQCEKCKKFYAFLIYAEDAYTPGELEDYATTMYSEVAKNNLPTWIIGPQVGSEPLPERPADILKIWPSREPIRRLKPDDFNAELDKLMDAHC